MSGPDLRILAPCDGWVAPLEDVPDPVFAERMLGDGLSIDPTGSTVHAPFAGEVLSVHAARHAVALRAGDGAEVLIHLGLETVALDGRGIEALVQAGDAVEAGQPLLRFDMDRLARDAKSLVTPIVVTNGERFTIVDRVREGEVRAGSLLMTVRPLAAAAEQGAGSIGAADSASRIVRVPFRHGVHARPAATLAACAKALAPVELEMRANGRTANVASPLALMGLGVRSGDEVTLLARGPGAEAAVEALAQRIAADLPETADAADGPATDEPQPSPVPDQPGVLRGLRASPGFAVGPAVRFQRTRIAAAAQAKGVAHETAELARVRAAARAELDAAASAGGSGADILHAHLAILDDPEIDRLAAARIEAGDSAGRAWQAALGVQREALLASGDPRIAERTGDLDDLEQRVLRLLAGATQAVQQTPHGAVLLADELLPSELLALGGAGLAGIATVGGGPTCHMAIIAQAMGVPALVALPQGLLDTAEGEVVALDADAGHLRTGLDPALRADLEARAEGRRVAAERARQAAASDARLADGARIEVFANLGGVEDAALAIRNGAEGCGLLRTEFLFLHRDTAPDEDEQLAVYQAVADGLGGRPLIVRTLDIGADKPAPYLPMPAEANPALGLRGVRISLLRPDLLRTQLRAVLRVRPAGQCRIMVPMVASAAELAQVRAILEEERAALAAPPIELGAMVETPAAAIAADLVAREADFLSVGSNDLTQYALAMDREHATLAEAQDGLHPAVLRLIAATVEGGRRRGRWVGVCGGLASDPPAALILVGLGVTELSAAPAAVPGVKAALRGVTLAECRALAEAALEAEDAHAVRALAVGLVQRSAAAAAGRPEEVAA